MDGIPDPYRILMAIGASAVLAFVWATGIVLRRARRDVISALLDEEGPYGRAFRELEKRYYPYLAAVFSLYVLLSVAVVLLVMSLSVGTSWVHSFLGAVVLLLFALFAPYRFVRPHRPETVVFFVHVGRFLWYGLFPLAYLAARWMSRSAGEGSWKRPGASEVPIPKNATEGGQPALETEERAMIHRILEFPDTLVNEVMVPRTDMVCLDVNTPFPEYVRVVQEKEFSRIPVYEDSVDNIIGILHVKDLIGHWEKAVPLAEIVRRPVLVVPESKKINELFRELRAGRQHLAIVLDEYGGTAGLVTIEDILEEIVGEIHDEFDAEEGQIREMEDGSYLLDGRLRLDDLNEALGLPLPEASVNSLGGFLVDLQGRVPKTGDVIAYDNLRFYVVEADVRRVKRVLLTFAPRTSAESTQASGNESG